MSQGQDAKQHSWHNPKAHAAIALRVPRSGIPELDDMIHESRRLDMATAVLHGLIAGDRHGDIPDFAVDAINFADALLAASVKESGE